MSDNNVLSLAKCALVTKENGLDALLGSIQRAEMPMLVGLRHGHTPGVIAATYACREADVLKVAACLLADLAREYVMPFHCDDGVVPSLERINFVMDELVRHVSIQTDDASLTLFDLVSQREREEVQAILPLFDTISRTVNRLKEISNGNIQAHSRTGRLNNP